MDTSPNPLIYILIIGIVLLKAVSLFAKNKRRYGKRNYARQSKFGLRLVGSPEATSHEQHVQRKNLLNKSETKFMALLREAFPEHYIFPQVSFNALITHADYVRNFRWRNAIRSKFNTKAVDFVLCDPKTLEVIAIIEYDGGGHDYKNDALRDRLLENNGYRVERFNQRDTLESIKNRFHWLLGKSPLPLTQTVKSEPVQF